MRRFCRSEFSGLENRVEAVRRSVGNFSSDRTARGDRPLGARVRFNFVWAGVGRLLSVIFLFAMHVFLAHKLPAEDYGRYVWLESAAMVISLFMLGGLPTVALRTLRSELTHGNFEEASLVAIEAVVILLGMSVLVCLGVLSAAFIPGFVRLTGGQFWPWLPWLLGWAVCTAILRIVSEVARGYEMLGFSYLVGGQRGGFGVNGAMLLFVVVFGMATAVSLSSMLAIQIVVQLLWAASALIVVIRLALEHRRISKINCRPQKMISLLCCSLPLLIQQLVAFGLPETDTMMLASYASAEDVALYGAGRKLVFFACVPLLLINHAIQPFIAEFYTTRSIQQLKTLVRGAATVAAVPGILWTIVLLMAPELMLHAMFGSGYEQAGNSLRILCLGTAVFIMTGSCGLVLVMTGHERSAMWSSLAVGVVYLVTVPFLIGRYGIMGAAIGSASLQICTNVSALLLVYYHERIWTGVALSRKTLLGFMEMLHSTQVARKSAHAKNSGCRTAD